MCLAPATIFSEATITANAGSIVPMAELDLGPVVGRTVFQQVMPGCEEEK